MNLSTNRQGELSVLSEAALWGLFPVVTVLSEDKVAPLVALGFSTLFACIFFAVVLTLKKKWKELLQKSALSDILISTLLLGIIYYVLTFFALLHTSPGNASIIGVVEIFFSFLFFHVWRKEELVKWHVVGAIFMVIGVIIIFSPNFRQFQIGDLLILLATAIAPFGNFFQRRARTKVSSESILFIRTAISAAVILFMALLLGNSFSVRGLSDIWLLLIINGAVILGFSKILWIEGIHRISVMKANALATVAPPTTLIFAWLILQKAPTIYQLFSFVPIFIGVIFLSINKRVSKQEAEQHD